MEERKTIREADIPSHYEGEGKEEGVNGR